jgi:HAMP domain-containing protein
MTDEDRHKLCAELYAFDRPAIPKEWVIERGKLAAKEIERLAARVNALEHIINLDMYEVTKTALVQAQDEIERLAKRVVELEALPPDNARWAIHDNHWTFR